MTGKSSQKSIKVEFEVEATKIVTKQDFLDQKVQATDNRDWPCYVTLSNGKIYGADLVVSATGVIPNGEAIKVSPVPLELTEEKAIKVNDNMRTNIDDIFASGDCCSASWNHAEHWFQMRLWTQARQFGMYAAQCMERSRCGEGKELDFCFEMFTHVTKFFGYKVVLLGLFNGQKLGTNYEAIVRVTKGKEYIKVKAF